MININDLDLSILKVLFSNKKYALEFVIECSEKLFSNDLWRFSKIVIDYIKIYKDVPTKRVLLDKLKSSKNEALTSYCENILEQLEKFQYDEKEYKYDLEKFKNRFSEKLIVNLKDNLAKQEKIDIKKSINDFQNTINEIKSVTEGKIYKQGSLKDYANEFKSLYKAKEENIDFDVGVRTGYTFLDYALAGLKPGELLGIAGLTNSGKSMFLLNMAINMFMQNNNIDRVDNFSKGANILFFSLEMSYQEVMSRMIARMGMVPQHSIRDAKLTNEEKIRVGKSLKFGKLYNHTFDVIDLPKGATVSAIERVIDDYKDRNIIPDVVVVDYLNIMAPEKNGKDEQDWLSQASIAEKLHELARYKEVVVLTALQLNPKAVSANNASGGGSANATIRRSTQILDNFNFCLMIETRKDEKNFPDISVSMTKSRRSALASGKLYKNLECCAILNPTGIADNIFNGGDISASIEKQ